MNSKKKDSKFKNQLLNEDKKPPNLVIRQQAENTNIDSNRRVKTNSNTNQQKINMESKQKLTSQKLLELQTNKKDNLSELANSRKNTMLVTNEPGEKEMLSGEEHENNSFDFENDNDSLRQSNENMPQIPGKVIVFIINLKKIYIKKLYHLQ